MDRETQYEYHVFINNIFSIYFRHIHSGNLGKAYKVDQATYKLLRKVMALCFLPHSAIPAAFAVLQQHAVTTELERFFNYVNTTWIQSTVWPPSTWSVYGMNIRTNNDVEGWHNRLIASGHREMPLYTLLGLLKEEAAYLNLQIYLVSEKRLKRRQRKQSTTNEKKINDLWIEYKNGDRDVISLLGACALLLK